jgi:antitoxin component YwqK of YwqJK toxin-antitoxin module
MASKWYFKEGNVIRGPFTSSEMRRLACKGKINRETMVRHESSERWIKAKQLNGLFNGAENNDSQASEIPAITLHPELAPSRLEALLSITVGKHAEEASRTADERSKNVESDITNFRAKIVLMACTGCAGVAALVLLSIFAFLRPEVVDSADNSAKQIRTLADRKANPEKVTTRHSNGSLKSEYHSYLDDEGMEVRHGKEAEWYPDGKDRLTGQWVEGSREGKWAAWHENGKKWVEGSFRRNRAVERWSYWDSDGNPAGYRDDGVKNGLWKEWSANGKAVGVGQYKKGLKQGKWTFFATNIDFGSPSVYPALSITFWDDIWHGEVTLFNDKGEPEILSYYEGGREDTNRRAVYIDIPSRNPFARSYGLTDRVKTEQPYVGSEIGLPKWLNAEDFEFVPAVLAPFEPYTKVYHPYRTFWPVLGLPKSQGQYVYSEDGKKQYHGKCVEWFANGRRGAEIHFDHGTKNGLYSEWYDNGTKKREGEYLKGDPIGIWRFYYASGRKKAELDTSNQTGRFWEANGQESTKESAIELLKSLLD